MSPRLAARRGATLIEAVAVVLVLAIAVPPTIAWMMSADARRTDAIRITQATTLAASVLDQVLSDSVTADIGASVSTYLNTQTTGLRARLAPVTDLYTTAGLTYSVDFSPAVDSTLNTSATSALNIYRRVTVTAMFVDSAGVTRSAPVTTVISIP